MATSGTRVCARCKEEKEETSFVKGKHTYCKKCQSEKSQLFRSNNREKNLLDQKKYRDKRGYEGRKCTSLKHKYGITYDDFLELLKSQNHCCRICHGSETYEFDTLVVDHCHRTGKVRGLLCTRCNKGLGMFKDNILALENAIQYLKETI